MKNHIMRSLSQVVLSSFLGLSLGGCATVGRSFHFAGPESVVEGTTTKKDILDKYGEPFRVGYENGREKWTYGYYRYRMLGDSNTQDLAVVFDKDGRVYHYTYSTSAPDDVKQAVK